MWYKKYKLSVFFLLGLGITGIQAQEVISTSGGNASGSGGSFSYTIGQIIYTTNTVSDWSVAQGVQQSYIDNESIKLDAIIEGDQHICKNEPINLNLKLSGVNVSDFIFQWYFNDQLLSGETSTTLSVENSQSDHLGTYSIKIQNKNSEIVNTVHFTVEAAPVLVKKWDDVVLVNNLENLYTHYQWYKNGNIINGAVEQFYQELGGILNGTYSVKLTLKDGTTIMTCPDTFKEKTKSVSYLEIYPNPSLQGTDIHISINSKDLYDTGENKLSIYNTLGVRVSKIMTTNKVTTFNTSQLRTGVYVVKVQTESKEVLIKKFIVN